MSASYMREVFADGTPALYIPGDDRGDATAVREVVAPGSPFSLTVSKLRGVRGPLPHQHAGATRVDASTAPGAVTARATTGAQTRMGWVRTTSTAASRAYAGDPALTLLGDTSGGVHDAFGIHNGYAEFTKFRGAWRYAGSARQVNDGRWHHIAAVYSVGGTVDVWVDGIRDATTVMAGSDPGAGAVNVICRGYSGSDRFIGDFAHLEAWNTELPPASIRARYLQGRRLLDRHGSLLAA